MTELTIKEKLLELLVIYKINLKKTFTIDFARLICEEMTVEDQVCENDSHCGKGMYCDYHQGFTDVTHLIKCKAQEILKALE